MSSVLVCIPCLLTGGTEIQTLSLVKALIASKHEVTTLCYFEHSTEMVKRYEQAGSEVVCLSTDGSRPQGIWKTIRFLYKGLKNAVKQKKYDIAHVQYMAPGAIPIILLRWLGIKKIVATAHTDADIYPSLKLLHFIQQHILTAFTCITLKAEKSFFGSAQRYADDIPLKKRGNHFTIYNNLPDYIQIRETPRSFEDPITIGVVSRLEHIKGMDLAVPAFKEIHAQHQQTRLLVVGDGALRSEMEKAANGIPEISFLGRQPQEKLQDIYDTIDILLVPSRSEGFGLTALEGMARGCVVVASDTGGLPEVVGNKQLLFHTDTANICEKITKVLNDKAHLSSLSLYCSKRANLFTTDVFNQHIRSLYQSLLKG